MNSSNVEPKLYEEVKTKVCIKCSKELPLTKFHKHKQSKDGHRSRCKGCRKEEGKQRYKESKDDILKQQKKYYESNKEDILIKCKQYRDKNKDVIKNKLLEYYINHRSVVLDRNKLWKKNNLEKLRAYSQKRRCLKNKLAATLTVDEWNYTKSAFNNKCAYCGKKLPLTQEHFIPVSKGGEYTINNIIPACGHCNSSKNNSNFFKWYSEQNFYNKDKEKFILTFLGYKDSAKGVEENDNRI